MKKTEIIIRCDNDAHLDAERFRALAAHNLRILPLTKKSETREAIRQALCDAIARKVEAVALFDSANPFEELCRLLDLFHERQAEFVIARPSQARRFANRLRSTLPTMVMRTNDALMVAVSAPFTSHWSFETELVDRLRSPLPTVTPIDMRRTFEIPSKDRTLFDTRPVTSCNLT